MYQLPKEHKKCSYYTGVGSREIPKTIYNLMIEIARKLAKLNYILRSGKAEGSDTAFEIGSDLEFGDKQIFKAKDATSEAITIAAKYHGAWHLCTDYAKKLHGRNVFQVLGPDLKTPSDFLICYTHDGCLTHQDRSVKTGGTGTAISVASENGIPVFNLKLPEHEKHIRQWLQEK